MCCISTNSFPTDFRNRPDDWQRGKVPAEERIELITIWVFDAVAAMMQTRDIIRSAFRGTGIGIDIDGKMKNFLRFPEFENYVAPEKDEEHIEEVLLQPRYKSLRKKKFNIKNRKRNEKRKRRSKENGSACETEQKIFRIKI